jgi:hypothetical protein
MQTKDGARFRGHWIIEIFNNAKEMKLISKSECHNIITDEGLNRILDVMLHGTTQTSPWYCELFESNTTPDGSETYDVPVYTPCTAYDEATRPEYNEAASSSESVTNSANKAVFTMNDTKTLYGAALVSVNTKGDHTGGANNVLFCAGKFGTAQPVISGNVVNLTYAVSAADDGV